MGMGRRLRQRFCPGRGRKGGVSHVSAARLGSGTGAEPCSEGTVDCSLCSWSAEITFACSAVSGIRPESRIRKRWSGKPWLSVTVPQTRRFLLACASQSGCSGLESPFCQGLPNNCHCAVSSPAIASIEQKTRRVIRHRRLSVRIRRKRQRRVCCGHTAEAMPPIQKQRQVCQNRGACRGG